MKKKFSKTQNGVVIYPIDYLMNNTLDDDDLNNLLDTPSLKYSVIIEMFKLCKSKKSIDDIILLVTTDNHWFDKYTLYKQEFIDLENKLTKIYQNIYYYNESVAKSYAQWFMIIYGFKYK